MFLLKLKFNGFKQINMINKLTIYKHKHHLIFSKELNKFVYKQP